MSAKRADGSDEPNPTVEIVDTSELPQFANKKEHQQEEVVEGKTRKATPEENLAELNQRIED